MISLDRCDAPANVEQAGRGNAIAQGASQLRRAVDHPGRDRRTTFADQGVSPIETSS
jgi:hypothetical protein